MARGTGVRRRLPSRSFDSNHKQSRGSEISGSTVPEVRPQPALDAQVIELQFDFSDVPGKVALHIALSHEDPGHPVIAALRCDDHRSLHSMQLSSQSKLEAILLPEFWMRSYPDTSTGKIAEEKEHAYKHRDR